MAIKLNTETFDWRDYLAVEDYVTDPETGDDFDIYPVAGGEFVVFAHSASGDVSIFLCYDMQEVNDLIAGSRNTTER